MKKQLTAALCLALVAGLFVSCGKQAENSAISTLPEVATENRSQVFKLPKKGVEGAQPLSEKELDELVRQSRISGSIGNYRFSYAHPDVPAQQHLCVSLRVYEQGSEGDTLLFSYDSDGAWLSDLAQYDPTGRRVDLPLDVKGDLSALYVMVAARLLSGEDSFSILAVRDTDGCMSEGYEEVFAWEELQ